MRVELSACSGPLSPISSSSCLSYSMVNTCIAANGLVFWCESFQCQVSHVVELVKP